MRSIPKPPKSWHRALALFLAFGALAVLLIGTALTTQAYTTKVSETTLADFASGEFHRTGLLDIEAENLDSVQLIPIGLVGTWHEDEQDLPIALTEHSAVAAGNHLIVMGGTDSVYASHDEVYVSAIGEGGALVGWVEQTNALPVPLSGAAAVVYPKDDDESWIYVIGGIANGITALDSVYYTTFNHNTGTVGTWLTSSNPLSTPTYYLGAAVHNGFIYAVGGYQETPISIGPTDEVFYAQIQPSGDLGPWQTASSLPGDRYNNLVVAYGVGDTHTLYVMGGRSAGVIGNFDVFFADIDPLDGSLTSWSASQGEMVLPIYAHSGALVSDQIFVTGGRFRNDVGVSVITSTVQAALVDPTNPGYRLYDWCEGDATCTIGAWLTGKQLPQIRAFHQTVRESFYIYTIGGVYAVGQPTASVYRGSMTDRAFARYAPSGYYLSSQFDFGSAADLRKLEWETLIGFPLSQTLELSYRYKRQGQEWHDWSTPQGSDDGFNELTITPPVTNVLLFQYRLDLTTGVSNNSPLFNWIDIYYELDDADLAVRKDTGAVISVPLGSLLDYTIYYSNTGQWVAENVLLTETLPANTTYAGDATWQQVGSSNKYVTNLGNIPSKSNGQINFTVQVNNHVPLGTKTITNAVEINYPTMIDELGEPSFDPDLSDNYFEFSNPLLLYNIDIRKESEPPSGSQVMPSQRITYTITYSNVGDLPLTGVVITDAVPISATYVPGSIWPATGDDSDPTLLRWTFDSIAVGVRDTVGFVVTVSHVPDGTDLENQAHADPVEIDPESSEVVVHTVVVPELLLTKRADPPAERFVSPYQTITYTLTFTNDSNLQVPGVVVTDAVPAEVSYVPGSIFGPGGDDSNSSVLKWNVGIMAPNSHVDLGFKVTVNDVPTGTIIINQADGNSSPTMLQTSNPVTHTVQPSDLILTKSATPGSGNSVVAGQRITYTISYFNNSDAAMDGVFLTDTVPVSTTYVPGSIFGIGGDDSNPSQLTWDVGTVLAQQGGDVGFAITVSDVPSGTIVENVGQGTSLQSGLATSNLVTHTVKELSLVLLKEATPAPGKVQPGAQIDYILAYSNATIFPMTGVVLSDSLPSIVDYMPGSIWPGTGDDSDPTALKWTIGDVPAGGHGTVGFAVTVNNPVGGGMPIVNRFHGGAAGVTALESNAVTHTTEIADGADLAIVEISLDPENPQPGKPFDLHVTVKNQGSLNADDGEFWVEAYVKPQPAVPPFGPADHYQGYCEDEACSILRPEYVEWRPDLDVGAQFPFKFEGLVLPGPGRHLVCVQIDVCFDGYYCNDTAWGWYPELDEMNNIVCTETVPTVFYIPAIFKNYHP